MVTLGEEPGEERVNETADYHTGRASFHEESNNKAGDERHDAEVVTPAVSPCFRMAPLEATVENECRDDWDDQDADGDGEDLKSNKDRCSSLGFAQPLDT